MANMKGLAQITTATALQLKLFEQMMSQFELETACDSKAVSSLSF